MRPINAWADIHKFDSLRRPELYRYQNLSAPDQCIRLLSLQPGNENQEIFCELVEHNLEKNKICYEALS